MPDTILDIRFADVRSVGGLDEATGDSPRSRGDPFLGLWAARRLGLPDPEVARYCRAVAEADHDEPGEGGDVLGEPAAGLRASGRLAGQSALRAALVAAERRAFSETRHHD